MALVDHVFAHGVQGVELPSFSVAVDANVSDGDLFCEVADEAGDVDEVIGVGDEEGVGGGHVGEVIWEGRERGCAEEAGELWVLDVLEGGGGLGRTGCAVDQVFPVPFRGEVGPVGVLGDICLSAGGWVREEGQEEGAYPHGSHRAMGWDVCCGVRWASFSAKRAAETGGSPATLRLMLYVWRSER